MSNKLQFVESRLANFNLQDNAVGGQQMTAFENFRLMQFQIPAR